MKILSTWKGIAVAALVLGVAAPAFAAFEQSQWKFAKDVIVDSKNTASSFAYIYLDREVASSSRTDWNDLRLKNSKGEEVAYQVFEDTDLPRETVLPTILDSSVTASGERQFILDIGKAGVIHNMIELRTSSPRYQRQVKVYGANELLAIGSPSWNLITSSGYIYKFSDDTTNFTGGSDRVSYPYNTSQYIKVVIGSGTDGAVDVTSASVNTLERKVKNSVTFTANATLVQNAAEKRSEYTFDLGSKGAVTYKASLSLTEAKNFNRRVIVESSNDGVTWKYVDTDYISRVDAPLFKGEQLDVTYPEQRARFIRMLVYNGDDSPIPLALRATFFETLRVMLFDAGQDSMFTLYYGNPASVAPQYDLTQFARYVTLDGASRGKLGVEKANPSFSPIGVPITERYPYLLTIVLIAAVLVVLSLAAAYLYKGGFMKTKGFEQNNFQ